jgi:predicted tellurium resistance membrane protein TerC
METTLLLAQVFGVMYTAVGLGVLLNEKYYKKILSNYAKSPALNYFAAVMVTIIGVLIVNAHNVWEGGLSVFITVIGWLALAKGISLLLFPEQMLAMTKRIAKKGYYKVGGMIAVVVGVTLIYLSLR